MSADYRIRVTKRPGSEAPLEIQEFWIMCEMPVFGISDRNFGVLSGQLETPRDSYLVQHEEALGALEARHATKAVEWWHEHNFPHSGGLFSFPMNCCEFLGAPVYDEQSPTVRQMCKALARHYDWSEKMAWVRICVAGLGLCCSPVQAAENLFNKIQYETART